MPGTGLDMQVAAVKETVYGTRAVPTRFFEVTDDNLGYDRNFYLSQGLGGGPWRRRRIQTTSVGDGTLPMEVPTVGAGFWFDLLHNNSVTPVQQAATIAYKQTHTLSTAPQKSATVQIGRPTTGTVVAPFDHLGVMLPELEFAWEPAGVLMMTPTLLVREQKTDQTLVTLTPPTSAGLFSFKGGSVTIGGSPVADIIGDGSVKFEWPLRDDAFPLGGSGLIAKPLPNERPTATGELTADFTDLTHYNRVVNSTQATVVLLFEGATIASTYKETVKITIADCGFEGPPPMVSDAGPVSQTVQFTSASAAGTAPVLEYISTDTSV